MLIKQITGTLCIRWFWRRANYLKSVFEDIFSCKCNYVLQMDENLKSITFRRSDIDSCVMFTDISTAIRCSYLPKESIRELAEKAFPNEEGQTTILGQMEIEYN